MSEVAAQLRRFLDAELDTLAALHTALDDEHRALLGSDAADLESATARKSVAVEAHRAQQQARMDWMCERALSPETTMAELLAHCGDAPEVGRLQTAIAALAARCQDDNRRNGGLIVRLQDRARGALDVLRRGDGAGDLYSLSGSREAGNAGRSLGKA